MAHPDRTLVEIRQQAGKHERCLRIGGLASFGPSHEYVPAIAGPAGRIDLPDVPDDDVGLRVGLQVRQNRSTV